MTPSTPIPTHASFESIRKQAKRLARLASANNPEALTRVQAQFHNPALPLSLRDAQLVIAREQGFAGWPELRAAMLRQDTGGLERAATEAERAIHSNNVEQLSRLIQDYPELVTWQSDSGETLLSFATASYGDSGDPYREQMFTRLECAGLLLDAGAIASPAIWESAIISRAKGVLRLLSQRGILPAKLEILAALGDYEEVQDYLGATLARPGIDAAGLTQAFLNACRFEHRSIAALILDQCIDLDRALGERVDRWRGRSGFIDYLVGHPQTFGDPWKTVVMNELITAIDVDNLEEFSRWLQREPDLLLETSGERQVQLLEHAVLKDRGAFITRLIKYVPTLLRGPLPPSSALVMALDYGNSHLIPLLTPIWPLPDDLCHAAGVGDFERVKSWFDNQGRAKLGSLDQHYPTNNPAFLRSLHWDQPKAQQVLDMALAWACVNRQFEIATFLLERGADINTNWSTHEPASILHECAVHGNYETAQFLIAHGIDMTLRDYRWNATAEGWARYAAGNETMANFLANAELANAELANTETV